MSGLHSASLLLLERQNALHPPSVMLAATRLLYYMSRIFEDHTLPHSSAGLHVDRKLRRKIQEKKIAMGHKPDDDEEEQTQGGMVMGGMYPLQELRGGYKQQKSFEVGEASEMITF